MKATDARSKDVRLNSCCAKTRPTKIARFFVHCLGLIDCITARMQPLIPSLAAKEFTPLVVEECKPFCSLDWSSCLLVILIDASLQISYAMNRDAMFISTDEVLVRKIAQHLIDALTGSPDH